jgi:predicted nucleotide-binding protein
MKLSRWFSNLRFPESVIRRAISVVEAMSEKKAPGKCFILTASSKNDEWGFDKLEDFFAAYPEAEDAFLVYQAPLKGDNLRCDLSYSLYQSGTSVAVSSEKLDQINSVMNVFQESLSEAKPIRVKQKATKAEGPLSIFIGHGRSKAWEELRNHLQDKHGYKVVAFESGARAGHHVRDILNDLLAGSSLAFLVLTGEDETADQLMRARQNVIHETGLFQGRLGFSRAVVLLEDGVEEFSNLAGIQNIPFAKGHINGTFGEVLAVIKREFSR